jgi:hypothetical protein
LETQSEADEAGSSQRHRTHLGKVADDMAAVCVGLQTTSCNTRCGPSLPLLQRRAPTGGRLMCTLSSEQSPTYRGMASGS